MLEIAPASSSRTAKAEAAADSWLRRRSRGRCVAPLEACWRSRARGMERARPRRDHEPAGHRGDPAPPVSRSISRHHSSVGRSASGVLRRPRQIARRVIRVSPWLEPRSCSSSGGRGRGRARHFGFYQSVALIAPRPSTIASALSIFTVFYDGDRQQLHPPEIPRLRRADPGRPFREGVSNRSSPPSPITNKFSGGMVLRRLGVAIAASRGAGKFARRHFS